MTPEQTIILNRIKDQVAKENKYNNFNALCDDGALDTEVFYEVCLRYAEEVNQQKLSIDSVAYFENVKRTFTGNDAGDYIDQEDFHYFVLERDKKIDELEQEIERLKVSRQKSCEASLERAAEKADYVIHYVKFGTETRIKKESITDPSNIVIIEP